MIKLYTKKTISNDADQLKGFHSERFKIMTMKL